MIRFEDIQEKVEAYMKGADLDLLRKAYVFSAKEHKGQTRSSGEPYLTHPLSVAFILADLKLDLTCIVVVKLADRLHNMRTLEHLSPRQQERIARETLDIYAPIANRLGMAKIKNELEDLALKFLDAAGYQSLAEALEDKRKVTDEFIREI